MELQIELAFEGVVDRLDELADLLEYRLAVALDFGFARRAQQLDALSGQGRFESGRGEALVGDQQDLPAVGDQVGVDLQHRRQDFPLAHFGVGQRPQDRHSGRGAHQVQAQAPEVPGVGGAPAVARPAGQVRALDGGPGHAARHRRGVDDPVVVEPEVAVPGQVPDDAFDQRQC